MSTTKKYWRSLEHLNEEPEFMAKAHNEFTEHVPVDEFLDKTSLDDTATSRRDFLKFLGFTTAAAALASCETPVMRSIPYVNKPEEITPGVANYYASTFADGNDYAAILVKAREGRPIMIEGNKNSGVTMGGVNARVNSSVLSLYDSKRIQKPMKGGAASTWTEVDAEIMQKLDQLASSGGQVRLLSNSILSPSTNELIREFGAKFGGAPAAAEGEDAAAPTGDSNFKHVTYDAISNAGIINANEADFGKAVIPSYAFDKAKVIVSLGADFLGTWLSDIEYSVQYAKNRKPDGPWMSKHYQFESTMSLAGSNADVRGVVKPSEQGIVAAMLYNAVASKTGNPTVQTGSIGNDDNNLKEKISKAAEGLLANKGQSLVVAGSNDTHVQTLVNAINNALGNIGTTVDLDTPLYLKRSNDNAVAELLEEMKSGQVDAVMIYGGDPAYSMPKDWNFAGAMAKVKTKISFATKLDDTAKACDYVCPDSHFLESWNDANPKAGAYSTAQPVISNLYDTRQAQESMLKWMGKMPDFHKYMQQTWEQYGYQMVKEQVPTFTEYWNGAIHDGVSQIPVSTKGEYAFNGDVNRAAKAVNAIKGGEWELELYVKTSMGDGSQASNPWLQELPDPVSKVVWDNYITMNPKDMEGTYETRTAQETPADMATVTVGEDSVTLPVVAIPGQKRGTIGIALGYGKATVDEKVVGANVFPMVAYNGVSKTLQYARYNVSVAAAGQKYPIASTQTHHTMMGRKIVNETNLETFKSVDAKDPKIGWNQDIRIKDSYHQERSTQELNLWDDFGIEKGHRWGMSIDLNTCTGCSACVTACHSENNVPVVGKDEVRRTRTMSWLRIDRYFSSDADITGPRHGHGASGRDYEKMEDPSEYPDVAFQPVMCQHCNHAPCETVCPVAATTHSEEGMNQMAYNRCVGTRYCANNCPFKVRRFNWFNYSGYHKFKGFNPAQDELGRMVLNPDVTVRSRGVMEKCSLCVQRIQAGKLEAKKQGTPVKDGSIQTACSSACPTNAISFGDLNDKDSMARSRAKSDRSYALLEEIGVQPNIYYMTKVRNRTIAEDAQPVHHGHGHEEETESENA